MTATTTAVRLKSITGASTMPIDRQLLTTDWPIPGMAPFALSANCTLSMALLPSVQYDSFWAKTCPQAPNVR